MKFKLFALLLCLALLLTGCGADGGAQPETTPQTTESTRPSADGTLGIDDDIVILYTNDVHCGLHDNLGYEGLSAIKTALASAGKHVLLVDNGDAVQGDTVGTLSRGEYIIDIMNRVGYDVATPGNHEFDYGMEQFLSLVERANFPYVSCNFVDAAGEAVLNPYVILETAGVKIAFVGITTPTTFTASTPVYFQNDAGEFIYSFCQDTSGEKLYSAVQSTVDAARAEGAQIVIAMAHLGIEADCTPWMSTDVITHTNGIDAVLDGHSHSKIENELVKNKDGKAVLLTSTETKLKYVGCLTIKNDGSMTSALLDDGGTKAFVADIEAQFAELINMVVASTKVALTTTDPKTGERMIRQNETNLGDLCADAYRVICGADIAFVNGGGVRKDIAAGDITYGDIIAVHPFGNSMCVVEATGQDILDALELGASKLPAENGSFLHVSGLCYTVDLHVPSSVKVDENGMFVSVGDTRRVTAVTVGGEPIDAAKTYTVASHDYMLRNAGGGYTMFKDNALIKDGVALDNEVLIRYIVDVLGGTVGDAYADPYGDGRITIIAAE